MKERWVKSGSWAGCGWWAFRRRGVVENGKGPASAERRGSTTCKDRPATRSHIRMYRSERDKLRTRSLFRRTMGCVKLGLPRICVRCPGY